VFCFVDLSNKECLQSPRGEVYSGTKSVTRSNKTCVSWLVRKSEAYKFPNDNNNAKQAKNYCRVLEPKYDERPWCYTTTFGSSGQYFEYCDIPLCCEFGTFTYSNHVSVGYIRDLCNLCKVVQFWVLFKFHWTIIILLLTNCVSHFKLYWFNTYSKFPMCYRFVIDALIMSNISSDVFLRYTN